MISFNENIKKIAEYSESKLPRNQPLGKEFYYKSLDLCVLDSVFSIGVKYTSVINVISNYCQSNNRDRYRSELLQTEGGDFPDQREQYTISLFIQNVEEIGFEVYAETIIKNKQRTSTKNGILKIEAACLFAKVLQSKKIEYFQDLANKDQKFIDDLETEIRKIKGQKSGISFKYFLMLAGNKNLIKPDRMIKRYLASILNVNTLTDQDCQTLLSDSYEILKKSRTDITSLRHYDNLIWNFQRIQK